MAIIGGNLNDIAASASRLDDSALMALQTQEQTKGAGGVLQDAVTDATQQLITQFQEIASSMVGDIEQSHRVLAGADWNGQSQRNAIAIKEQLKAEVGRVLDEATLAFQAEQRAFNGRAAELMAQIDGSFGQVMKQVDVQYRDLATAAKTMRDNLEAADQTIRMG